MSASRVLRLFPGLNHLYELLQRNLAVRIAALVVAIIVTLIITLVTIHTHALRSDLSEKMVETGVAKAEGLANVSRQFLEEGQLFELVKVINEGSRESNVLSISVYDPRRLFLMRKEGIEPGVLATDVDPMISEAMERGAQVVEEGLTLEIARPVYDSARMVGVVRISLSMASTHSIAQELVSRTSLIGLVFALVITPIIFVMMDRLSRPIRKLTAAAERASRGDLDVKIEVDSEDEVGVLADSFNRMLRHMRSSMKQIHDLAYVDNVTGLPNRERFRVIVDEIITRRRGDGASGIIFIDLDRFKRVNDTLGHSKGDELLQVFALRLQNRLRMTYEAEPPAMQPTLARLSGDEYAILLPCLKDGQEISDFAKRLKRDLDEPFLIDGHAIVVGASMGATIFPQDGLSFDTLLRNADMAMYKAKEAGGGCLKFYTEDMRKQARSRLVVENELRQALENDDFVLFYQPQLSCRTGELKGVEALIRWNHPEKGLLAPGQFIEVAEETGLVVDMGEWVMHTACMQAKKWFDEGRNVRVAINVSALQFERGDFTRRVMRALEDSGAGPEMIELELTESIARSDIRSVVPAIHRSPISPSSSSTASRSTAPSSRISASPGVTRPSSAPFWVWRRAWAMKPWPRA